MPRREPRHAFIAPERLPIRAFAPFLRSRRQIGADNLVLEKDPAALKPVELPFFRPAALAPEVIPQDDVLLITGTMLINETLIGRSA